MSNVIDDQTLTDGVKVENPLRGDSCFFIEASTVFNQNTDDAFGPKSTDEFKTTSKITFSGDKNIYAICDGLMLIQPQLDSLGNPTSLVNVIIKPVEQPIQGLAIKYFVYRGLKKSDFVSGNQIPATGTQFINDLNNEFNGTTFLAKYIGLPTTSTELEDFPDTMLIDELFYNKSTFKDEIESEIQEDPAKAFQVPYVYKGDCIGTANDALGIDIILDSIDTIGINGDSAPFKLDLKFARSADHKLDLDVVGLTDFQKKLIREASCQFMDVASYLGLHANGYGKLYLDGNTNTDEATNHISSTADIYGKMSGFATKNTTYITVMGHRGRSYNFYNQHSPDDDTIENIKIGLDEDALTHKTYGTFGWPIEVVDYSSSTYLENQLITSLFTKNKSAIKAYCITGNVLNNDEKSFIQLQINDVTTNLVGQGYSALLYFKLIESSTSVISQPYLLVYQGQNLIVKDDVSTSAEIDLGDINNVFSLSLVSNTSLLNDYDSSQNKSSCSNILSLLSIPNGLSIVSSKKTNDHIKTISTDIEERVTFETIELDTLFNGYSKNISMDKDKSYREKEFNEEDNDFYKPEYPLQLVQTSYSIGKKRLNGLKVEDLKGNKLEKYFVGITKSQYNKLVNKVIELGVINPTLFLYDNYNDFDFNYIENNTEEIYVFRLGIVGESENGTLKMNLLDEDISIYTIDKRFFFSELYSDSTKGLKMITNEDDKYYEPTGYLELGELIGADSILTDGAILRSDRVVDVRNFEELKLDRNGFLLSFRAEDGNTYKRFYGKNSFKFDLNRDDVDYGLFLRVNDYLSHRSDPSEMPIQKLRESSYNSRFVDLPVGLNILISKFEYDYSAPSIKLLRMEKTHDTASVIYDYVERVDHNLRIKEEIGRASCRERVYAPV